MFAGERPLSLVNSPYVFVQRALLSELLLAVGTNLRLNIAVQPDVASKRLFL
jgi:hypothetical protein